MRIPSSVVDALRSDLAEARATIRRLEAQKQELWEALVAKEQSAQEDAHGGGLTQDDVRQFEQAERLRRWGS